MHAMGINIYCTWYNSLFIDLGVFNIMKFRLIALSLATLLAACNTTGVSDIAQNTGSNKDAGLAVSAAIDAVKAFTLSDADVKAIGLRGVEESDKQAKVAPVNSKYAKRLAALTKKHMKEDGLQLNFKVYLTPDINAFASPDGSIRVYSGLMDMMNDDELRYVLGHEIGHVKLGHSLSAHKAEYITRAGRKGLAASGGKGGQLAASELGSLVEEAFNAQYSQEHEREADDYGLAFNKKYKHKPQAAITALEKLAKLGGKGGLFASHPAPAERAQRLREQLKMTK